MMAKEKPVGEILKEEGIIKEEIEEKPVKEEIDVRNVLVEVEKLKAIVDTLKAVKFEADERIKELAESVGEVRSLYFQRDASIKEMETKLEKIEEGIKDIRPERIKKTLEEKEKELEEINAKIEKFSEASKDLNQRLSKVEKVLEGIKSIENLKSLLNEIEEKVKKIEDLKSSVEKDASKTERFYLESERRLSEMAETREKVEKLEELTKELVRSVDENKIKLDACVTREELKKAIEEELKIGGKKEEKMAEIEERKKEITTLLSNIEEQYKKGIISESSYNEVVEKNKALLEKLEREAERLKTEEEPKGIGEFLEFMREKLDEALASISLNEKKIAALEEEIKKLPERKVESVKVVQKPASPKALMLKERLKEIEELLASIEDQYRSGIISEKTYQEVKEKNAKELERISKEIEKLESFIPEETPDVEVSRKMEELLEHVSKLEEALESQRNAIKILDKRVASLTIRAGELEKRLSEKQEMPFRERIEELKKKIGEIEKSL